MYDACMAIFEQKTYHAYIIFSNIIIYQREFLHYIDKYNFFKYNSNVFYCRHVKKINNFILQGKKI